MKALSETEYTVAEKYCHGLTDKEIASCLDKPIWTVRTHKKHIYKKLSISTTHELVLYMVAHFLGKEWNSAEIRRRGLAAILLCMFVAFLITEQKFTYIRGRRVRVEVRERGRGDEWS